MDACPSSGIIKNAAGGSVRGGHEYECFGRDAERDLWWFCNSWGPNWGKNGTFAYDSAAMAAFMARGSDIAQGVPVSAPLPVPTPADADLSAWWAATKPWSAPHKTGATKAGKAAAACNALALKKGLS